MKASLSLVSGMHFVGRTDNDLEVHFDTSPANGGNGTAASPMQMMMQSVAACSAIDVVSILRKRRRQINGLRIDMSAERAETHPRIFTTMHLSYIIDSPDVTDDEMQRAITLSQDQYCSASAIVKRSGCVMSWDYRIERSAAEPSASE
jgi:putative redox protein